MTTITVNNLREMMGLFDAPFLNIFLALTRNQLMPYDKALAETKRIIGEIPSNDTINSPLFVAIFELENEDLEGCDPLGFEIHWVSRSGLTYKFKANEWFLNEPNGACIEFPTESSLAEKIIAIIER